MKISTTSLTLTALAFVLAAPGFAAAKGVHTVSHVAVPKIAAAKPAKVQAPVMKTGLVDTLKQGSGSYSTTITKNGGGSRTIQTTETFANGATVTKDVTLTRNSDGSIGRVDTTTGINGKTSTSDDTIVTNVDGTKSITGTITTANGKTNQVAGTIDPTAYGHDTSLTITNASGATKTVNGESFNAGDASANVTTGTGFKGQSFENASVRTTDTTPNTNVIANTGNGQGTYTVSSSQDDGTTTYASNRTFADGANSQSTTMVTPTGGDTANYNKTTNAVNANGVSSTTTENGTFTGNGSGSGTLDGTFSQSNGHDGTYTGDISRTAYGYSNTATYTDQNGAVRTAGTQQLVVGDAEFNINKGTDFAGKSTASAGLLAGQASNYAPIY